MLLSDQELLHRLVSFDSVSRSNNAPIADFICEYLERPGITVNRNPSKSGSKVNLIAQVGPPSSDEGERAGEGLALCGHLDVVPADEPGWTSPPFELTECDGTLVGRGACDMKCSVALAMNLLAETAETGITRPLAAIFTYDEELGSLGAQRFCETWHQPLPKRVVVGEPTSLRVVRMHKGHMTLRITVHGRAAHSGSPQLGTNAIEASGRIIQSLARLANQLKQRRLDNSQYFSEVPFPVLNISQIRGGTAINIVPEQCVIDGGLRLLPGMNDGAAIAQIRDTVAKSTPGILHEVEVLNNNPPLLCPEKSSLHVSLCKLVSQLRSFGLGFASDAGALSHKGFECVLFGPGSIEVAHRPNEFVPISEFQSARKTMGKLVEQFCG